MSNLDALTSVKVQRENQLWVVTIERSSVQNALGASANQELSAVFDAFVADREATVAILTGSGAAFCSGHDYAGLDGNGALSLPPSGFGGLTRRWDNPKIVIAGVNGDALDEGFELALSCDLIIANEDARFALQQAFWGRAPVEGGVHRLVRQIPLKKAMAALLTGTPINASEGVLLGFVNDITGYDQVVPVAREWADRVKRLSPQSVRAIKQSAMHGLSHASIPAAMEARYSELDHLLQSREFAESVSRLRANRRV